MHRFLGSTTLACLMVILASSGMARAQAPMAGGPSGAGGGGGGGGGLTGGPSIGTGSSIGTGGGSLGGGGLGTGLGAGGSATGVGTGATAGTGAATSTYTVKMLTPTATGAASSNPIGPYYANPLSAGKPGGNDRLTGMWTSLYTTTTTTATPTITGNINTTGLNSFTGQAASILNRRGPAYTVAVTFPYEPPTSSQLQTEAQGILARSDFLTMRNSIKVKVDGQTLVLEGQVRNDQERRLAENMVRLTPGVRQVRNNLQVAQTAPPPRQVP